MLTAKPFALVHTLGCRLNSADSALLYSRLAEAGYELVSALPPGETAALIVVNSCAVTAEAVRKSRQMLRRFRREHPAARLVLTGCAASAEPGTWDGADLVVPNDEKSHLTERLRGLAAPKPETGVFHENACGSFPFRSRAFIKIQEGCDNFCTYCIVPYVRGRERSRSFGECVEDCRHAAEAGFPEIVLTGVNTCAYNDAGRRLGELLDAVCALPGEFRVRLSSTEPDMHHLALLDAMARNHPKVCRFLHLSLQHGDDAVLRRMHRHYTSSKYADFVAAAREKLPGIHIGTDFIVGFPGETESESDNACRFVEKIGFANTHLFRYSPRPGTPAATYPDQVPPAAVEERFARLTAITDASAAAFARSNVGLPQQVIFEHRDAAGLCRGWTDHYLAVAAAGAPLRRLVTVTPSRYENGVLHV